MLLFDLPLGARVMDSGDNGTVFLVAAHDHPGYGGTTLVSDCIVGQLCYDAAEPDSPDKRGQQNTAGFGNNSYPVSNLHQWLNASGTDWFSPAHDSDAPPVSGNIAYGENPYSQKPGFLTGFTPDFIGGIIDSDVPCFLRDPDSSHGRETSFKARVFIPSAAEIGMPEDDDPFEGTEIPLFSMFRMRIAPISDAVAKEMDWKPRHHFLPLMPGSSFWYWLRTPHETSSFLVRYYNTASLTGYTYAANGRLGVRCMLNMDRSVEVSDTPNEAGIYVVAGRKEQQK